MECKHQCNCSQVKQSTNGVLHVVKCSSLFKEKSTMLLNGIAAESKTVNLNDSVLNIYNDHREKQTEK